MIIVKTFNDGFEISGHAYKDEPGKDLVCAAVSAISQGIINCFPKKNIDVLEINKQEDLETNVSEGNKAEQN